jgi:D-2-hydroxyacid dehydrogenase (NADP+)
MVVAPNPVVDVGPLLRAEFPDLPIVATHAEADAKEHWGEVEVLLTIGNELTSEIVAGMPRLAWVQCLISGTEQIERTLAGRPDVLLTSGRGVHGPPVAEMAIAHMLVLGRGLRGMSAAQARHGWEPRSGARGQILAGRTVGVVGMGTIGRALVDRCRALEMRCVAVSDSTGEVPGVERVYRRAEIAAAAAEVDYLIVAVPLDAETEGLIDAEVLTAMKPTAYLVNVARGPIVVEGALIAALTSGSIAGAGLDALTVEPPAPDNPLWDLENVFITPHVAGINDRYVEQVYEVVGPNVRAFLAGEREGLRNVVGRSL